LQVGIKITSGPVLDAARRFSWFVDKSWRTWCIIYRRDSSFEPIVEEYLYSAMEDFKIDIMIESGPNARTVQINLNPFTLIGATTRSGY
jgi:Holliday junction DNA helicase RuvB